MNTGRLIIHATYVFEVIWIHATVSSAQVVTSLGFRWRSDSVVRGGPNLLPPGLQKLLNVIMTVPKELKY
jgi:hypothetical protein